MQWYLNLKSKIKKYKLFVGIYEKIMGPIRRIIDLLKKKCVKTRFSYGRSNRDKVFYIITSEATDCGLFSLVLARVLPFLYVCEKKGYVPIVDFKNTRYHPMIQEKKDHGKENPWEYYFEQPGGQYPLEEVYRSAKVEICNPDKYGYKAVDWNHMMPMPMESLKYWSGITAKYIHPTKMIMDKIKAEKERLFLGENIMGVSLRAGYRRHALLKQEIVKGHPKVADCEYYIKIIQQKMDEWGYDKFFLACDDREYTTKIFNCFGEKCLYTNRSRMHLFVNDIPVTDDNGKEMMKEYEGINVREMTVEYMIETYLLAACESLYSTINGSGEFAYIVNGGKYKHFEAYDEGLYQEL